MGTVCATRARESRYTSFSVGVGSVVRLPRTIPSFIQRRARRGRHCCDLRRGIPHNQGLGGAHGLALLGPPPPELVRAEEMGSGMEVWTLEARRRLPPRRARQRRTVAGAAFGCVRVCFTFIRTRFVPQIREIQFGPYHLDLLIQGTYEFRREKDLQNHVHLIIFCKFSVPPLPIRSSWIKIM